MGGGGESAEAAIRGLTPYLVGHDPFALEALRWKIANPTATLYNNRLQLLAALEFACLDIMGKALDLPVHALLGGKLRDAVPFASYIFFRYTDSERGGEVRTTDQLLAHARALKRRYGFTAHKLKGGVFPPAYELTCYRALADALPADRLRYDPNCALSLEEAIRFGKGIRDLNNDYLEDPTWGLDGARQLRRYIDLPLATNTAVINFEQLGANIHHRAFDVVLLDTTFSSTTSSLAASLPIATARSRFPTAPASASRSIATSSNNTPRSIAAWAGIPMTAIPAGPAGMRWCRTRIGRIRLMSARRSAWRLRRLIDN